ncbi:MAG: hypothetical protein LUC95_07800 [Lachnospiraceae bacterium]|nr:hypothetical protein [Lachnospiraceae bacterium]
MKGKEFRSIILCVVLTAVVVLVGCLNNRSAAGEKAGREMETESFQRLSNGDFIVYGEVSAVGEETLTIKLGTLETEEEELILTGGEVAIRTKAGTVIERLRLESAGDTGDRKTGADAGSGFAIEDLEEGDIVSIALDEEGYAEKITLMNFSAVGVEEEGNNG